MESRQKLFVYDRREMSLLIGLILGVSLVAFTLGVHLGKRVGSHSAPREIGDAPTVATSPDQIPNRQELTEQSKATEQAAEESLNQALHDEVARTGIKLETPRQVQLPRQTRTSNAGATGKGDQIAENKPNDQGDDAPEQGRAGRREPAADPDKQVTEKKSASEREEAATKFALQIGSYPTKSEARHLLERLELNQLKGYMVSAELPGRGIWHRVFVGEFLDREKAEQAGVEYRSKQLIESYIVATAPSRTRKVAGKSATKNEIPSPKSEEAPSQEAAH